MVALFEPIEIRGVEIPNRVWVPPMCMYSVPENDGVPNQFHLVHYGALANGGFGLIIAEASAVSPEGRISPNDCGMWSKTQMEAWKEVVEFVHEQGAKIGIQLGHAGRKGSIYRGFPGEKTGYCPSEEGGWDLLGPSAKSFGADFPKPIAMTRADIDKLADDFRKAARRARKAGFDVIELHMAHGYLCHQFLSPFSNERTDKYGGDFDGRIKLPLRIVDEVRKVWNGPLFVRISATEWVEGGWTTQDTIKLAKIMKEHGVDLMDCSSGGNAPAKITLEPGYQVPLATEVRKGAKIPTATVGLITEATHANQIIADELADAVLIGRAALRDPYWPAHAAAELGVGIDELPIQPQYYRGWRARYKAKK